MFYVVCFEPTMVSVVSDLDRERGTLNVLCGVF